MVQVAFESARGASPSRTSPGNGCSGLVGAKRDGEGDHLLGARMWGKGRGQRRPDQVRPCVRTHRPCDISRSPCGLERADARAAAGAERAGPGWPHLPAASGVVSARGSGYSGSTIQCVASAPKSARHHAPQIDYRLRVLTFLGRSASGRVRSPARAGRGWVEEWRRAGPRPQVPRARESLSDLRPARNVATLRRLPGAGPPHYDGLKQIRCKHG
jgi:hypothetical protein